MPIRQNTFTWDDTPVEPGTRLSARIHLGENPVGQPRDIPVYVLNGAHPGPVLAVTGAVHGNELNGIGIIHHLAFGDDHVASTDDDFIDLDTLHGTLLLVPVINVEGLLLGTREMPDRRDLNRMFPGRPTGNQSQRLAHAIHEHIVRRCDVLVDLHTAAATRMNVPHVRADLKDEVCRDLARAFGTSIVLHSKGAAGTLRRESMRVGIPTILLETGSSMAFEVDNIAQGVQGVLNIMGHLGMIERTLLLPAFRLLVRSSRWLRADHGGLLHRVVDGGQLVHTGDTIALVTDPFGARVGAVRSTVTGLIIGLATTPLVRPGDPIAHVVIVRRSLAAIEAALASHAAPSPEEPVEEEINDDEEAGLLIEPNGGPPQTDSPDEVPEFGDGFD